MKGPAASDTIILSPLKHACTFILRLTMVGVLMSLVRKSKVLYQCLLTDAIEKFTVPWILDNFCCPSTLEFVLTFCQRI